MNLSPRRPGANIIRALAPFTLLATTGCVLWPDGARDEQARVDAAREPYKQPFAERALPELPERAAWRDVLHRALLASGELEAAYFEWSIAMARVEQAGAYPNSPVSVSAEYMFGGASMKSWDRTTVAVGFDAMENLAFPTKVSKAAEIALHEARAAGERFRAAKFAVQRRALETWADYSAAAEKLRLQQELVTLLSVAGEAAQARAAAGEARRESAAAELALATAQSDLLALEEDVHHAALMLNAMMARAPDAPLPAPDPLPEAREAPGEEALLALGVANNPALAELGHRVLGATNAIELARMQYIPDINPFFAFTGSATYIVGAGVSLPTVLGEIRSMIRQSRDELAAVEAMRRQTGFDTTAAFVAAVYTVGAGERREALFTGPVLAAATAAADSTESLYTTGGATLTDLIESRRTLIEIRMTIADLRALREKSLAAVESLAAADVESLTTQHARTADVEIKP